MTTATEGPRRAQVEPSARAIDGPRRAQTEPLTTSPRAMTSDVPAGRHNARMALRRADPAASFEAFSASTNRPNADAGFIDGDLDR